MSFNVVSILNFEKDLKNLAKKYPSIHDDYEALLNSLEENSTQGIPLGKDCYKIRMSIKSKGKGKSGGARIITCVKIVHETIYLLTIFDKSEKENISAKELEHLLKEIGG
jgi:mRNA-degrading endonuclease RelE of RelBE toxin-antitoxin system